MPGSKQWLILAALLVTNLARAIPTVCEDESCRCDSFTRVICSCLRDYDEVTLRADGPYRVPNSATAIIINGCARVYFLEDTVKELQSLRSIELRNVNHIYIKERALSWSPFAQQFLISNPGLRITIENSTINEISSHSITGRVDEISIRNSQIQVIRPFAFSSLTGVKHIEFNENTFHNIEIQAFKKFTTHSFTIRGGTIKVLPSRFLSDIEVINQLRIDSVHIDQVSSLSFLVNGPQRTFIENNSFGTIEGDGFHIMTTGPIVFRNNSVHRLQRGAFLGFSVMREITNVEGPQELLISTSTVDYLTPSSFLYDQSSLRLKIDRLNLNTTCSCALADDWRTLTAKDAKLECWDSLQGQLTLEEYVDSRCGKIKQNFWIIIVVAVALVILAGIIITIVLLRKDKEKKKKLAIVMPDGKTYRETELHIIVERADLLTTDL